MYQVINYWKHVIFLNYIMFLIFVIFEKLFSFIVISHYKWIFTFVPYIVSFSSEGSPNFICIGSIKPRLALAARISVQVWGKERPGIVTLDVQENKVSIWEYFNLCWMILNVSHSFVVVMMLWIFFLEVQCLYMYYYNFLYR